MADARARAAAEPLRLAANWPVAAAIAALWLAGAEWGAWWAVRRYGNEEDAVYLPAGMALLGAAAVAGFAAFYASRSAKDARRAAAAGGAREPLLRGGEAA